MNTAVFSPHAVMFSWGGLCANGAQKQEQASSTCREYEPADSKQRAAVSALPDPSPLTSLLCISVCKPEVIFPIRQGGVIGRRPRCALRGLLHGWEQEWSVHTKIYATVTPLRHLACTLRTTRSHTLHTQTAWPIAQRVWRDWLQ